MQAESTPRRRRSLYSNRLLLASRDKWAAGEQISHSCLERYSTPQSDGNSAEAVHHGRKRRGPNVVDHLWIRVRDADAARAFYATVAPVLGLRVRDGREGRVHIEAADRSFALLEGTPTANLHIAFSARDDATVDAFHAAALAAGYRDNGAPGERPEYHPGYYGAFVLDPDR
jgi:catechol 2,3-dioxygenase-like lactoylglutathione lyase family enzyme